MSWKITIISGGQTGVDRAALDFAIRWGVPHGGWCANGRQAQDGPLDAKYRLRETPTGDPVQRIECNVRDADAVVVFTLGEKITRALKKAITLAKRQKKPWIHLHPGLLAVSEKLMFLVAKYRIRRLNVAGPRESEEPGIYDWVTKELEKTNVLAEKRQAGEFQYGKF